MPARLRKIALAVGDYKIDIEKPSGGSHWLCKKPGFRPYTIPSHKGLNTMVGDEYIRGLCRHFGIDRDEFIGKL